MSKRTQEDAGEERVTAKSKSMTNLVSRCRVRDTTVLASTASENPENTKSESQEVPLSPLNVQQTGTVRPVMLASSSNSSEWNNDDKWSSQVRKSCEMSKTSTVRLVYNKLEIDIEMDSDTATESYLSLQSRSFLHRVNARLRKMLNRSPEDSMQDIDKRSLIWWMFISSTVDASVFMGKNYSDSLHSIKNTVENLTLKMMFEISEQLILEKSDEIFGVSQISWESSPWNSSLWSMMKKSSVSRMQRFTYSQILCYVLERWIRTQHQILFGSDSWNGSKSQNFGHNRRWADGIRVEYFPRIHHSGALQQSPGVHAWNGRSIRIWRTDYLHVDVQWHHIGK